MSETEDMMAKWLVGDRLSSVLHVTDSVLAYRLFDQGHEVTIVGTDVVRARRDEIQYVRSAVDRLPFMADCFDAVLVPDLSTNVSTLAEYARVLRPAGMVSTLDRTHDETIPWFRRLVDIIGEAPARPASVDTMRASGLFEEPESRTFAAWEELDLGGLIQFVRRTRPGVDDATIARVTELFSTVASGAGKLRLRHQTEALRARVLKPEAEPVPPTDTVLLEFR